jgi:putative FmdB family regulatory protein
MPTYEYTCKSCNENIEVFQSFSEKPLRKHADCGGELQKVFHARGVVFKGSGFYATDSRNGSDNSSADSKAKKGSGDSKGKDKSKREPKPKTPARTSSKSSD